jgi:hypothetical protein
VVVFEYLKNVLIVELSDGITDANPVPVLEIEAVLNPG